MTSNKIAWEKWDDDLIEEELFEDLYALSDPEDEEDSEIIQEALEIMSKIPKLVSTPTGMAQIHDKMSVLNQFDCWMGHTNFDITKAVQNIIETAEGVELLQISSRYRFFVGVGRLFNFADVRRDIESILCNSSIKDDLRSLDVDEYTQDTVELIKETIHYDKHWVIFVRPTGEVKYASTNEDNDEGYLNKLLKYERDKEIFGGLILQNEN